LVGKLSWGACEVFGKGARVHLSPLYWHANGHSWQIAKRLALSLEWWCKFLHMHPTRLVPLFPASRRRALIYTDATGKGTLAWIAEVEGEKLYAHALVPPWLSKLVVPRQKQIATWELVAALSAIWALLERLESAGAQWEVHVFIDSTAALGTLLRGSSRQTDWNSLVSEIWLRTACMGILLGLWRVPSRLNIADWPTRMDSKSKEMTMLHNEGFHCTPWSWPRPWLDLK
jgi:hypothetical protein